MSAAAVNPAGVMYLSWQAGIGHMVSLGRDQSGVWGMRQHRLNDGTIAAVMPLEDAAMPVEIRETGGHGTMVVFLGDGEDEDTTRPPHGETGERWLRKAINQRFYELPDWAVVKVREIRNAGDQSAESTTGRRPGSAITLRPARSRQAWSKSQALASTGGSSTTVTPSA